MPRKYVQTARADASQATRRAILDAARATLLGDGPLTVGIGEIAGRAGVARSTVYAIFGSRAGLLAELSDDVLHGAGLGPVIDAYRDPDPVRAIDRSFLAASHMYAADREAFARLQVLASIDPEAAVPVERSDGDRRAGMDDLGRRIEAAGRLRDGVTPERAAQVLSVLSTFHAWDELATQRGLDPDAAAEVLLGTVRATLMDG
jgi:AcrR family transcriptional regulator